MISSSPGTRERSLQHALLFCLLDLCLMGTAAYFSSSVTILGDVLKEFTDFLSVLAAVLTIRAVRRSPDHQFTYGIGKLENLASLTIGVAMLASALFITWRATHHLHEPRVAHGTLPGILIFGLYSIIGYGICFRTRRLALEQASIIMESQARLWFSKASFDAVMGSALLVAYFFQTESWSWYLDPLASLLGVLFMLHAAWAMPPLPSWICSTPPRRKQPNSASCANSSNVWTITSVCTKSAPAAPARMSTWKSFSSLIPFF